MHRCAKTEPIKLFRAISLLPTLMFTILIGIKQLHETASAVKGSNNSLSTGSKLWQK
jgi:hypothetical protein